MKQNALDLTPEGEPPVIAAASLLSVRYPAAIDTPPSVQDDVTPLSGVVMNYLALMLEAIQVEVGPAQGIRASSAEGTLLRFLGIELNNRVSNWRSIAKAYGGNEAGQIFGVMGRYYSQTGSGYNVVRTVAAQSFQGVHPMTKQPIAFCESPAPGTLQEIVNSIGGGVRCRAQWSGGGQITYDFRGHPAAIKPVGPCAGSHAQGVHILILYPYEAQQ